MNRSRIGLVALALLAGCPHPPATGQEAVSVADYSDYAQALRSRPEPDAQPATFAELWRRPAAFRGKPVIVAGCLERRFRQPAIGDFPALTEAWVVDAAGNPLCLVYPSSSREVQAGARVQFVGTFLRTIRFGGQDADRLAPLLVGPRPPEVSSLPEAMEEARWEDSDWILGLALAGLVVVILATQHLRLRREPPRASGPAPRFVDPNEPTVPVEEPAGGSFHGGP